MGIDSTREVSDPREAQRLESTSTRWWLGPTVRVGLSLALGLWRIGAKSLWLDEATSVQYADVPLHIWWSAQVHTEVNSGLYYLLLRGWMTFGHSEAVVRLPSAIAVGLAAGAVPLLVRRFSTTKVALLAGLLTAAAPVGLHYAQEARSYGFVLVLTVVSAIGLVRAVNIASGIEDGRSGAAWAMVVAAATLAAYMHVLALLVVGAQVVALVALPAETRRRIIRPAALSVAAVVVLVSPLVVGLLSTYSSSKQAGVGHPTLHQLGTVSVAVSGGSVPAFLLVAALAAWAVATAVRQPASSALRVQRNLGWFPVTFLVVWAGVPILTLWAYAYASSQSTFVDRYVIGVLPPIVVLAAAGLVAVGRRWLIAAAVLIAVVAVADVRWYRGQPKEDWRDATATVLRQSRPGDGIVFGASYTRVPFTYYAERRSSPVLPDSLFPRRPWTTDTVTEPNPSAADRIVDRAYVGQTTRLWLILSSHDVYAYGAAGTPAAEISFWVPPGWTAVEDHRYTGVDVRLYERLAATNTAAIS